MRVLSLFSGIGGLDLGFEATGFTIAGSVEIDEQARESLALNRNWRQLEPHDVQAIEPIVKALDGSIDVVVGAPPCQPFSKAAQWMPGKRNGLRDDRGMVLFSVLDLVAELRPKVVVLENVQGFVRGATSVLPVLQGALADLESATALRYEIAFQILDAHAYGVPQRRRRAIVVLSRVGSIPWPEPMVDDARPVAWDAIGDIEPTVPAPEMPGKWADLLPSIPEGENYQWHTPRGRGLPIFGYRTRYWSFLLKLAKHQPAWTLAAQPGPSTGPFHWESRPLTEPEMLRLQGFPADWKVSGDRRAVVRQIGNATPPALAEAIAREVAGVLEMTIEDSWTYRLCRLGDVPPPEKIQSVPQRFVEMADWDVPDHPGTGRGPGARSSQESRARTLWH